MKRLATLLIVALVAVALAACNNPATTSNDNETDAASTSDTENTQTSTSSSEDTSTTDTTTDESSGDVDVVVADRPGELPPEPKVVGDAYGLSTTGVPGGKLVRTATVGPKSLNNMVTQETSSSDITRLMHRGLTEVNPRNFEVEPALAKSWDISEDETTFTFHLREGVKFSDGEPFTADDVVFTFNDLILNEDVNADVRSNLTIKGEYVKFEKVDDYTVKVTTPQPFRPLLRTLGQYEASIYPKHLMADKVAKLNPGVRGVMRFVRQTLESNVADLEAASATGVELLSGALDKLGEVISAKNAELAAAATMGLEMALNELKNSLGEGQSGLSAALNAALEQVGLIASYVDAGKWEGVPPGTFNNQWTLATPASEFAGLGPYRFVRYDVDQQVVLERNPYYWKVDENGVQLPYMDQLVTLVVENWDVMLLKFRTGESDSFDGRPEDWSLLAEDLDPDRDCTRSAMDINCLDQNNKLELKRSGPLFGTTYVVFNQDIEDPALRAVFRNKQFRKAVAYGFDKDSMIDNIYNGLGVPQWSPVSLQSKFFDDTELFVKYPLDIEQAGQMLDELGLIDTDGDGTRNITDEFLESQGVDLAALSGERADEDVREMSFAFNTNSGNTLRERISALIVTDMAKLGMGFDFKPMDFNALVSDLVGSKFEIVLIGFTGTVEPFEQANIYPTSGDLHFWRYSAKDDPPEWEARVDELFELVATEFDEVKVKEYFKEFQYLVSDNLPLIFTVNRQFVWGSSSELANNEHFQPISGNIPSDVAFSEILWWENEERRSQTETVEPQG